MNDVLLTGLPRSGTTLSCELLNLVPGTVALDEPMSWDDLAAGVDPGLLAPAQACANVALFMARTRQSVLTQGAAVTKHVGGKVTGKKISDQSGESGTRVGLAERGVVTIDKELGSDFTLVVKHVAGFTALLDQLSQRFPVFALVRNPLAVLNSWQTVPLPIREGHVVIGEALDTSLADRLATVEDRLERQFLLLDWFFGRFRDLLPESAIIRYEDLVAEGGRTLAGISPGATDLAVALRSRNHNPSVYDQAATAALGARLLDRDGAWWAFYPPDSVRRLLDELE